MAIGLSGVSGVAVVRPVAVDHKRACVLALIHPHLEVVLDVQEAVPSPNLATHTYALVSNAQLYSLCNRHRSVFFLLLFFYIERTNSRASPRYFSFYFAEKRTCTCCACSHYVAFRGQIRGTFSNNSNVSGLNALLQALIERIRKKRC